MSNNEKSYTEKFKQDQNKIKDRAKELFDDISPDEEPQSAGDPLKIFEDDDPSDKDVK